MEQFTLPKIAFWFIFFLNIIFVYVYIDMAKSEFTNRFIKKNHSSWPTIKAIIQEARIIEKEARNQERSSTSVGGSINEYIPQIVYSYQSNGNEYIKTTTDYFGGFPNISNAVNKIKELIGNREFKIYKKGKQLDFDDLKFLKGIKTSKYANNQDINITVNPKKPQQTSFDLSNNNNIVFVLVFTFVCITFNTLMFFSPYKLLFTYKIITIIIMNASIIGLYFLIGDKWVPAYKEFKATGTVLSITNDLKCNDLIPFMHPSDADRIQSEGKLICDE